MASIYIVNSLYLDYWDLLERAGACLLSHEEKPLECFPRANPELRSLVWNFPHARTTKA